MRSRIVRLTAALALAVPVTILAFSTGPPTKRTGAPIDGGLTCTACHATYAPANSDPRGSVTISAGTYTPGVKQTIKVTVMHPEASRWGFQITARMMSDPSKQAGTFAVNDLVRVRCDTTPASDAPCNGALEFPEHNNAPVTDVGAGFTFSIDWTPPATNVGDVIFYAAGNAANNDHTFNGDRIYNTRKVISPVCSATAKPSIRTVVNGGSFKDGLSANALITIFGQNFTPTGIRRGATADDFVNNTFPQQLACLAVEIDGKRAPILYAQSDQINVQVPTTSSLGPVTVKVLANPDQSTPLASDAATVQLTAASPAFFTFDGKAIAAQFAGSADVAADPSVVPGARPAKPGDIVTIYGTGCGATNPAIAAGAIATGQPKLTGPVKVTIAGTTLADSDVLYAGLSPGSISGLFQLNVRIPATAPDGNVPVVVQIGSQSTQDGTTLAVKK